jgi:hypothetical protein
MKGRKKKMTLPDYLTGIQSQMSSFMNWTAVATPVQLMVGTATVCVMLALFMAVLIRH